MTRYVPYNLGYEIPTKKTVSRNDKSINHEWVDYKRCATYPIKIKGGVSVEIKLDEI